MKYVKSLPPGAVVIDIGANVGLVSETLARRGLRGISFEPNTSAFAKLKSLSQNIKT